MTTVAIVGLGYVGLPLAIAFGRKFDTIGYDLSDEKIANYLSRRDPTGEVPDADFRAARKLRFTGDPRELAGADFIIVAVPTPVDGARQPDFSALENAAATVGRHLKRGVVVIFESTVYPGATEEICVPILEQQSGKKWKRDFHVGYSPERINPGDREHTIDKVVKVVAADDAATLDKVAALYGNIVSAGLHRTSSIRVAEAAKVIENTQRDLNIALMNELAIIFDRLGLDTQEVLAAAATKWNFLPFRPGLVGGHCIGVDPYYLTYKAEMVGYHPQVILAGRRINDGMGKFVAEQTVKLMIRAGNAIKGAKVNVLGLTFKENCPDIRNTRVIDVINELRSYGVEVFVHDPVASPDDARREYGLELVEWDKLPIADAVVVAVPHRQFAEKPPEAYLAKTAQAGCVIDVRSVVDLTAIRDAGRYAWRL